MIKTNFHTHTYRCNHADGTEEDYVLEAIKCGLTQLGISDHGPEPWGTNGYRMLWEEADDYLDTISALKEKYSGRIKIFAGFEYEYARDKLPVLRSMKERDSVDYFALGPHEFYDDSGEMHNSFFLTDKSEFVPFAKSVAEAMETGLYSFVAHPDLYAMRLTEHCAEADEAAYIIAKTSLDTGIPLEINANGMRRGHTYQEGHLRYPYPYWRFWDTVAEVGSKVIIGADAHCPGHLCDAFVNDAVDFAERHKVNLIDFTGDML